MNVNETKNTTILAMDVVGYSAKMNEYEIGFTEKLKIARIIIEKFVDVGSGKMFNTWWNYMMGLANYHLDNTEKSKEFINIIQNLYGDNPIEKHKKGNRMWNMESIFIEKEKEILVLKYY